MDLGELWAIFALGFAGAVFGAGWWFWVDAVVCSSVKVGFVHYLPGILASLVTLMFNCVKRDDIDYSPYEEGEWSGAVKLEIGLLSGCLASEAETSHLAITVSLVAKEKRWIEEASD
uniref:Transmembrane protein 50 homolog n=1 Tax=Nelumbo nucifera TaxID=4432 RepID=A0A822YB64_NELNU|nr:TPA_asm: hypothetical protein HUJ06_031145 [Nelumbo nucifera]